MTIAVIERPASVSARDGRAGPNLLKALVGERHWSYEAFRVRFESAAAELAKAEGESRLRSMSVAERTYYDWLAGRVAGVPQPDACRVLEHLFGRRVEALFGPASQRPETKDAPAAEVPPAVPVGVEQLLGYPGVPGAPAPVDAEAFGVATRLANLLTAAFLAGVEYAAGPGAGKAVA